MTEIRTERLILRKPRPDDLKAVVDACQDPDIPQAGFVRVGVAEHTPRFRDGTKLGVKFELA